MAALTIALLQLLPGEDTEENLALGLDACRRAAELGADIALFPEMWSCGYRIPQPLPELRALAVAADGAFVSAFGRLAGELGMAVAITYLERFGPSARNALALFDRRGQRGDARPARQRRGRGKPLPRAAGNRRTRPGILRPRPPHRTFRARGRVTIRGGN